MRQSTANFVLFLLFIAVFTHAYSQSGSWNKIADLPQEIWRASGFSVQDTGYVALGFRARNGSPLNNIWAYDESNDQWVAKENFPGSNRGNTKAIVFEDEVYFFGGDNKANSSFSEYYDDFWKYNPSANEWDSLGTFPGGKISNLHGFVVGDTIYVGFGRELDNSTPKSFYAYHPASNQFFEKKNPPFSYSSSMGSFSYDNRGFIAKDSIYEYHPSDDSWEAVTQIPSYYRAIYQQPIIVGSKAFFIDFDTDYTYTSDGTKVMGCYDFVADQWTDGIDFGGKKARYGTSFAVKDKMYYGTGDTGIGGINFISDFFEFDPAKASFLHPNNLIAAEIGVNHITLEWEDRSDNESAFIIERKDYLISDFVIIDTVGADITIYKDTLLTPNTTYNYYVRAINSENSGGVYSNMRIVRTKDFPATPDTLIVSEFSKRSLWLYWVENANNEDGFIIRRKSDTEGFTAIDTVGVNVEEYMDTNLDSTKSYTYQILAFNDVGSSDTISSQPITPGYNTIGGWIAKADFPGSAGSWSSGASTDEALYINGKDTENWWEYDIQSNLWTEKAIFPGPLRENAVAFTIGDSIYFGAGMVGPDQVSDFWAYSISADTWSQISDLPEVTFDVAFATSNGKGYVLELGGNLYEYDPSTGQWTEKAHIPDEVRVTRFASGVEIGGKIYFGLGPGTFDENFYEYDPQLDQWTKKADFPGRVRGEGVAFVVDGLGYFGTGDDYGKDTKDFWKYDPINDAWERSANFPKETFRSIGFTANNTGYVYDRSGYTYNGENNFIRYEPNIPNFVTGIQAISKADTIEVSWIDNANNENGFYIYRQSENESRTCIDTLSANSHTFIDTAVVKSVLYTYEVEAFNTFGSSQSIEVEIRALNEDIPNAPDDLRYYNSNRNSSQISWTRTNGDIPELFYVDVSNSNFSDTLANYTNTEVGSNYIQLTDLEPETTYQARVRSYNYFNTSENSEIIEWTTFSLTPEPPSNISVSEIDTKSVVVELSHSGPSADTFLIDLSKDFFQDTLEIYKNYPTVFQSFTLDNLEPNTEYQIRIRASYQGYVSENSDTLMFKTKTEKPNARSAAIAFVINDMPYLGLGQNSDSIFNDLWRVNLGDDSFDRMASFPGPARSEAVAFVIDGTAYVGSGRDKDGNVLADFYSYDPVTDAWTQIADLGGEARRSAVSFVLDGSGYVGTGRGASSELADFWKYDPASNSWSEVLDFTGDARQEATAFVINGKAYVSGGIAYTGGTTQFSDVQEFDPNAMIWSEKVFAETDLNINQASAFTIKNKAHIAYGNQESIVSYDPTTNEVRDLGDALNIDNGEFGDTRADAIAFVVADTAYFGFGSSGFSPATYHNDLQKFYIQNSAPSNILLNNLSFNENEAAGTVIGSISVVDEDTDDTHTIELVADEAGDRDNDLFNIDGNNLTTSSEFNYEERFEFTINIQVTDSQGATFDKVFVIQVEDVNDAPEIAGSSFEIAENSPIGTIVGQISSTDEDDDALTLSIISSTVEGAFEINDGQIEVSDASLMDHESNPQIDLTVRVDDGSSTAEASFLITINNINEAPQLTETSFEIHENSSNDSEAATLQIDDPEGQEVSVTILSGNESNTFYSSGTSLYIGDSTLLDFESTTGFEMELEISDGENQITETVTINILNLNEAPTVDNLEFSIPDDSETGTIVGELQPSDPEGDDLGFTILAGQSDPVFDINAEGQLFVSNSAFLDADIISSFNLEVEVSDAEFAVVSTVLIDVEKILGLIDDSIIVYPNPTSDILHLKLNWLEASIGEILIYSQEGKLILKSALSPSIDVSALAKGTYTLVITTKQNAHKTKFNVN